MIFLKNLAEKKYLIFAIVVYLSLNLPFFGSIPYLDGNIDFVKAHDFYSGGFDKLFLNWTSIHPPFKEIVVNIFYKLSGVSAQAYEALGISIGVLGIYFYYLLTHVLLGNKISRLATLLLATSPLFISVGFFALTDFILTVFLLASLYFYIEKKYLYFGIFASLANLTKETGIVFISSIILVEIFFFLRRLLNRKIPSLQPTKILGIGLPLLTSALWYSFLKSEGKSLWSDWNFSDVSDKGSFYTILNNLFTFNFINKYALQNFLQLLVLNFNWIFWLLFLIGVLLFVIRKKSFLLSKLSEDNQESKTFLIIFTFIFVYLLTVLTFQTYTIPRYALPIFPFLFLGVSWSITKIQLVTKLPYFYLNFFTFSVVFLSLFTSSDPISTTLWGKMTVLGEQVYALNKHLAGNDGITYNMQYINIAKKRSEILLKSKNGQNSVMSEDCYWTFPDPNNDKKTILILNLKINMQKLCTSL